MDSPTTSLSNSVGERWSIFASKIKKEQVIYFSQILIVYTVIIAAIVNLSLSAEVPTCSSIWASILSGSVGYVLPAPKIRKRKLPQRDGSLLPNPA